MNYKDGMESNEMKRNEMKWNRTNFIPMGSFTVWVFSLIQSENFPSRMKFEKSDQFWSHLEVCSQKGSQLRGGFFLISSVSYEKNCVLFFNFPSSLPSGLSPQTCSIVCLLPKYYNLSFLLWCNQLLILCWKHDE